MCICETSTLTETEFPNYLQVKLRLKKIVGFTMLEFLLVTQILHDLVALVIRSENKLSESAEGSLGSLTLSVGVPSSQFISSLYLFPPQNTEKEFTQGP